MVHYLLFCFKIDLDKTLFEQEIYHGTTVDLNIRLQGGLYSLHVCLPRLIDLLVGVHAVIYVDRAVARALIWGGGGLYIHIFVFCPTNFF